MRNFPNLASYLRLVRALAVEPHESWPRTIVENGQPLAGDHDDRDFLRLAGCSEALEEGPEHGVVLLGQHGAHELGLAQRAYRHR